MITHRGGVEDVLSQDLEHGAEGLLHQPAGAGHLVDGGLGGKGQFSNYFPEYQLW